MMTHEEIKLELKSRVHCSSGKDCCGCPADSVQCNAYTDDYEFYTSVQEYIEQLETKVTLMKIQMHGYCMACRNYPLARAEEKTDDIKYTQLCRQCWMLEDKPFWEYEGLPGEVEQHAESL